VTFSYTHFSALLAGELAPALVMQYLQQMADGTVDADELCALVLAMHEKSVAFPALPSSAAPLMDVCGTGGDGLDTPNISTAVALVVAACGVKVAKHGNRAASGKCGSADVLEALGVQLAASPTTASACLDRAHICFLFAPYYHPALRHLIAARKALGRRTLFNLAGPLANPARPTHQLVGVYNQAVMRPMAEALHKMGIAKAWVVHSRDGMDEISTTASTDVLCLQHGEITPLLIDPTAYDIIAPPPNALRGGDVAMNAALLGAVLQGAQNPLADIIAFNAAAALLIADHAADITDGLGQARKALQSGAAYQTLQQLIGITHATITLGTNNE
jgi:anthranilate phosphoribosyltransferase